MLILAATPIGNSNDASKRLILAFETCSIVAAEDTRSAILLAKRLEVKIAGKLISLHDHNESQRIDQIVSACKNGEDVLLISDAGMPLINDPGFKVAKAVEEAGERITCLPGPSAPLTALVLSGLPTHRFCFEGFLPPKSASRISFLKKLQNEERTMIFLESTHRIAKTLEDMKTVFGEHRQAAVARELTKSHEEILRGNFEELCEISQKRTLKGEICIVVAGAKL